MREFRPQFKESNPGAGVTEVAKAGGAAWRALGEEEKGRYKAAAAARNAAAAEAEAEGESRKRAQLSNRSGAAGTSGRGRASLAAAVDEMAANPLKRQRRPAAPVRRREAEVEPTSPAIDAESDGDGAWEPEGDSGLLDSQLSVSEASPAPRSEHPARDSREDEAHASPALRDATAAGDSAGGHATSMAPAAAAPTSSDASRGTAPVVSLADILEGL